MVIIDGSHGEGGGQILRSAIALSMVTGTPFSIEKIRAGRRKPGLMRQHLTAVRAAMQVCNATVRSDEIGSTELTFTPVHGRVPGGKYQFSIGTAGSTTLVLQTVLPALLLADGPSELVLEGGTHNPFAPPFDFLAKTFLPLVNKMGPKVTVVLEKPGFYPAGGGRFTVRIEPADKLRPIELMERGEVVRRCATAKLSNLSEHIAERELKVVARKLGWPAECLRIEQLTGAGPGNVLTLEVESEHVCEVFTGFGEVNRPSEAVANQAVQQCQRYLKASQPVGEYLCDQLLLPLAIAGGGAFNAQCLSRHAETHIHLIRQFMDCPVDVENRHRDGVTIRLSA